MRWLGRVGEPRPRLRLDLDPLDRLLEGLALVGWLLLVGAAVAVWPALPERLPMHFDFAGRPDGWGSRASFLILPILGTLLYLGLTAVGRYPHVYNFPWPITAENAERQYRLARRLIAALKGIVVVLFAGLTWGTARVATGASTGLPPSTTFVFLLAFPAVLVLYFVAARRAR